MKLKSVFAASILAAASFGAMAVPGPIVFGPYGNAAFDNRPSASFSDVFTFSVPDLLDSVTASVTSSINGFKDVDNLVHRALQRGRAVVRVHPATGDPNEHWSLASVVLHSGINYMLTVTGVQANLANFGNYAGQISVSPVPEPRDLCADACGPGRDRLHRKAPPPAAVKRCAGRAHRLNSASQPTADAVVFDAQVLHRHRLSAPVRRGCGRGERRGA